MRWFPAAAWAVCTLLYPAAYIFAQVNATGTFSGQVTDPTGAAVSNAQIKVIDQSTGIVTIKKSASDGYYTVPLLKPGTYSLEVSAPGFATSAKKDIVLQIQQVIQQDFQLQVGDIQQQVTVEASAALLNTESTEVGNVISQESVQQLP